MPPATCTKKHRWRVVLVSRIHALWSVLFYTGVGVVIKIIYDKHIIMLYILIWYRNENDTIQ